MVNGDSYNNYKQLLGLVLFSTRHHAIKYIVVVIIVVAVVVFDVRQLFFNEFMRHANVNVFLRFWGIVVFLLLICLIQYFIVIFRRLLAFGCIRVFFLRRFYRGVCRRFGDTDFFYVCFHFLDARLFYLFDF